MSLFHVLSKRFAPTQPLSSLLRERTCCWPRAVVVVGLTALLASAAFASAELPPTPSQMYGPYYPLEPAATAGSDLTQGRRSKGVPLSVVGRVRDRQGRLQSGVLVEIWQTNAYGRYHHPHDRSPQPLDAHFNGYGRDTTGLGGNYRFTTVVPATYPGRTPHIHFRFSANGRDLLVTQMYLPGEPLNQRDGLFTSVETHEQRRLIGVPVAESPGTLRFDVVIEAGDAGSR